MYNNVAEALKAGRNAAGLTADRAGELCGLSTRDIFRYESGAIQNPNPHMVMRMAEIYGDGRIELAYLEENPVFLKLIGTVPVDDFATSVLRYESENEDDRAIIPELRKTVLHGMQDIEEYMREMEREVRETMTASLALILAGETLIINAKKETAQSGHENLQLNYSTTTAKRQEEAGA